MVSVVFLGYQELQEGLHSLDLAEHLDFQGCLLFQECQEDQVFLRSLEFQELLVSRLFQEHQLFLVSVVHLHTQALVEIQETLDFLRTQVYQVLLGHQVFLPLVETLDSVDSVDLLECQVSVETLECLLFLGNQEYQDIVPLAECLLSQAFQAHLEQVDSLHFQDEVDKMEQGYQII